MQLLICDYLVNSRLSSVANSVIYCYRYDATTIECILFSEGGTFVPPDICPLHLIVRLSVGNIRLPILSIEWQKSNRVNQQR